jgi:DNA-binding response OmpR family regulator
MSNCASGFSRFIILVVEDDPVFSSLIRDILETNGYLVQSASSGEEALKSLKIVTPHLILTDLYLSDINGLQLLKQLKKSQPETPLIFVSGFAREIDIVLGLELGAEDYIVKPIKPEELLARIRKVLGRKQRNKSQNIQLSNLSGYSESNSASLLKINLAKSTAKIGTTPLSLTNKEFELLVTLAATPDTTFSRTQLLGQLWANGYKTEARTVDVHISRLRKKMREASPDSYPWIYTLRGSGYIFRPFLHSSKSLQT